MFKRRASFDIGECIIWSIVTGWILYGVWIGVRGELIKRFPDQMTNLNLMGEVNDGF